MIVKGYKTHKILRGANLYHILDDYLPPLQENTLVAIASKIVGICEGRVVAPESPGHKDELVKQEADYYLPRAFNQYDFMLTINHSLMIASAGIDESNANGLLSLWPKDPQLSANKIREYLTKKHNVAHIGVIITDSKLTPLRKGVTSYALAHSGFRALNSYVGKPDIFGRIMRAEQLNVADTLAASAVAEMGEGNEQQPLAVISDAKFVHFQQRNPTEEESKQLKISIEDDVYATLLKAVPWKKGKKQR